MTLAKSLPWGQEGGASCPALPALIFIQQQQSPAAPQLNTFIYKHLLSSPAEDLGFLAGRKSNTETNPKRTDRRKPRHLARFSRHRWKGWGLPTSPRHRGASSPHEPPIANCWSFCGLSPCCSEHLALQWAVRAPGAARCCLGTGAAAAQAEEMAAEPWPRRSAVPGGLCLKEGSRGRALVQRLGSMSARCRQGLWADVPPQQRHCHHRGWKPTQGTLSRASDSLRDHFQARRGPRGPAPLRGAAGDVQIVRRLRRSGTPGVSP